MKRDPETAYQRNCAEKHPTEKGADAPENQTPGDHRRQFHKLPGCQIELAEYVDLYAFAPAGYITLDREGIIRKANRNAARLFGMDHAGLLGVSFFRFIAREAGIAFKAYLAEIFAQDATKSFETALLTENNQSLVVRLEAAAAGSREHCRMIIIDITEHKRNEREGRLHQNRLEELMHKRTEDLRHTQFAIDTASEAVLWVSENGRMSYANNAACSLFEYGREDFLGMSMFDLFDTYTPPKWNQYWSMIKEQGTITYVYPYTTKSGKKKFLELHCNYFEFHEAGEICTFIRDITDKILAQKAVKQSNKFLENIFSTIADGFLVSYAGVIVRSNSAAERLLGYDAGELIGMYTADLIPGGPAYAELRATIIKSHASGEMLRQMEAAFLKKNGALVPVEFSLNHLKDDSGNVTGAVISMRDITERKQSQTVLLERECELQQSQTRLRQLSAQVLQAQEEERRRLARELHDDLGQALALLKIRICSLGKKISDHESALQCDCRETERYLEQIIDSIRRISRDLSPAVLEDLGLTEALRILCAEFARHHNLELTCSLAAIDGLLAPEAQINLYRFCQEALTNIQKHSRADRFSVVVECQNNYITLRIQDNGMGFNTGRTVPPQQSPRGMGLTTLEERAGMLHGSFTIRSDPGAGTSVALQFPVVTAS